MGYSDENDNNEFSPSQEIQNAKSAIDSAKSIKNTVDSFKSISDVSKGIDTIRNVDSVAKATKAAASITKTGAAVSTGSKFAAIATGVATGPAGWVALAGSLLTNKRVRNIIIGIVAICLLLVIIFPLVIGLLPMMAVKEHATQVYDEVQKNAGLLRNYYSIGTVNFNDDEDFWNHVYEKYQISEAEISSPVSLYGEELEMNVYICKDIIDNAIDWAFKAPRDGRNGGFWTEFVKSDTWLGRFFEASWDWLIHDNAKNASYDSFLKCQYPYTLAHEHADICTDGTYRYYYTIEDYMNNRIPEDEINNDINYAEIISMISLNKEMASDQFTFEKFYNLLMSKEIRKSFAELDYKERYYCNRNSNSIWDSLDEMAQANNYIDVEQMKSDPAFTITAFLQYDVYPYGLCDLAKIADITLFSPNYILPPLSNIKMLDQFEVGLRSQLSWSDVSLGISGVDDKECRDWRSKAYHSALQDNGTLTGRSAFSYVDLTGILYEDMLLLAEWDEENIVHPMVLYEPNGTACILDFNSSEETNAHSYYIYQLDYPNDYRGPISDGSTIRSEGCIDCCYTMCAQYLLDRSISIRGVSSSFVRDGLFYSGGTFEFDRLYNPFYTSEGFLNSVNLFRKTSYSTLNQQTVRSVLIGGSPVIFCIYGSWWSQDGRTLYHRGYREGQPNTTHFITIIGFDDNGFYVLDPANKSRKQIPFCDFLTATITSWSVVSDTAYGTVESMAVGSSNARFICNTCLGMDNNLQLKKEK